jgi:hypothetical protein
MEVLEQREVMTTSGNISAVVDYLNRPVEYGIASGNVVYEHTPSGWTYLGAPTGESITQVSAGKDANGRAQVFALGADNSIWRNDGAGWQNLPGAGLQVCGTVNNEVYALGTDHAVYVNNLSAGTGFQYMGGWLVEISAGLDAYHRDQVFALGGDGSSWMNDYAGWQNLGAAAYQIEGTANNEVYLIGADHGVWLQNLSAGTGWQDLGGYVLRISAGTDTYGRDEVFAIGGDWTAWKLNNSGWHQLAESYGGASALGGRSTPAATGTYAPNVTDLCATGRDTVFAVGTSGNALEYTDSLWNNEQGGYLL